MNRDKKFSSMLFLGAAVCLAALLFLPLTRAQAAEPVEGVDYAAGDILVKLNGDAKSISATTFKAKVAANRSLRIRQSWSKINLHRMVVTTGDTAQTLASLRNDPAVAYAEPNFYIKLQSTRSLNYPKYEPAEQAAAQVENSAESVGDDVGAFSTPTPTPEPQGYDYCSSSKQQTSAPIDRQTAWNIVSTSTTATKPVVVAVVDTGIDENHLVFVNSGAVWTNSGETGFDSQGRNKSTNGVDDDSNGYIDDVHGWNFQASTNSPIDDDSVSHGTHVSGIILGTTEVINNYNSIAAASIRIMPLKFLDSNGEGTTSDAINAIYYAVDNGASVINNSWGGSSFSNALLEAIDYAYNAGVTVVTAAGNSSSDNDTTANYPSNYNVPNVIAVAASMEATNSLASFSNYGAGTVHLASPGNEIYSTISGGANNLFACLDGTSMATPFVSGVAAMMLLVRPALTTYQVKSLILSSVTTDPVLSGLVQSGGRLDAGNAVQSAQQISAQSLSALSSPSYNVAANERGVASAGGAGCGRVSEFEQSSPTKGLGFFAILALFALPLVLTLYLRDRSEGRNRRQFPRYQIDSSVKVKFGDREMMGAISTISMGGAQLNTEAMLEQGGIVTMTIASPDGKEQIQVQGHVVWSEEQKRYGVQFAKAEEGALAAISRWTQKLMPQR